MGKTKADFELSPCSVKTYYFKVRVSQPKRGHSQLFLKLCFLKHTPKYWILKKKKKKVYDVQSKPARGKSSTQMSF